MEHKYKLEHFDGVADFLEYYGRPTLRGDDPYVVLQGSVLRLAAEEIQRLRSLISE